MTMLDIRILEQIVLRGDQGSSERDEWPGIRAIQIDEASSAGSGCRCRRLKSIQSWKALGIYQPLSEFEGQSFAEWSEW